MEIGEEAAAAEQRRRNLCSSCNRYDQRVRLRGECNGAVDNKVS